MLEIISKIICGLLMVGISFYFNKRIIKANIKYFNLKNIILILFLTILIIAFRKDEYTLMHTLTFYLSSILIFSLVTKEKIGRVFVIFSISMLIMFVVDILTCLILMPFFNLNVIRQDPGVQILANVILSIIMLIVSSFDRLNSSICLFTEKLQKKNNLLTVIFLILLMVLFVMLTYYSTQDFGFNRNYLLIIVAMIVFMIFCFIMIAERNSYINLTGEYDTLFQYIQTFEDWIEKEQENRHEHKNQLAVIRMMTKDKKVQKKIDEMLADNINIDSDTVNQLKFVPNGGLKGILYYKVTMAKNKKINLTVDVNVNRNSIINKMSEDAMKVICKLVGIYFDNAIEATTKIRKRNIMLEIYEYNKTFNIVLSNTFNLKEDISKRNEKGFSTKGEGRGNGLFFAKKLIDKADWLSERQDIIDGYYIQKLSISKDNEILNNKKKRK